MAGTMRKMAVYLGLVEDDLDADYEPERPDPRPRVSTREPLVTTREPLVVTRDPVVATREPVAVSSELRARPAPDVVARAHPPVVPDRPAATFRPTGSVAGADMYRITTLHPRTYNDARGIGEEYREGVPVIVNLTGMDDGDAKRIVDFAAGIVFGLRGNLERITNKVFLLSPANVDVGAEARAQIAQDGFFNQS
ncbi:MAG: cell division protein SepF [Candidatus Nanopelagicales bacterium]